MVKIKKIDPLQAAQVVATIYFFVFLIIFIPIAIFGMLFSSSVFGMSGFEGVFFFIAPFIYAFISFIFTAIFCVIYNYVSGWLGGIMIEIEGEEIKEPGPTDKEENYV